MYGMERDDRCFADRKMPGGMTTRRGRGDETAWPSMLQIWENESVKADANEV